MSQVGTRDPDYTVPTYDVCAKVYENERNPAYHVLTYCKYIPVFWLREGICQAVHSHR